jgi:putative endonuclease
VPNFRGVGRAAEDRAAEYLIERGFTIVTRRYKTRRGEIDLIALDGDVLVFVEVKERRAPGHVPEESISRRKIATLVDAANTYLVAMGEPDREARFDVIAIDRQGLRHHVDVFRD